MKAAAIIINIFIPGVGSYFVGKPGQATTQLLLWLFGVLVILLIPFLGLFIGMPLCLAMWIWGIVTAASANPQPMQVTIVHQQASEPAVPAGAKPVPAE